ncbi:MAG: hypothetical protein HOE69_03160 [Euryarchaeota archaeon]|nr:hypothetical protein [Euryarchaeota archaeon]
MPEEEKTFDELEEEVEGIIAEDYAQKKTDELSNVLDELGDDTLVELVAEKSEVPVEFHVGDATADDLLEDAPMVDHYGMAEGDAIDPSTADKHLAEASASNDEMGAYEQIDVPVMDDDIEWQTKSDDN